MEVSHLTRRQLHRYTLLITAVMVVFLAAIMLAFTTFSSSSKDILSRALTKRVITIRPSSDGLTKITTVDTKTIQTGPDWTQAGSETAFNLGFK